MTTYLGHCAKDRAALATWMRLEHAANVPGKPIHAAPQQACLERVLWATISIKSKHRQMQETADTRGR